MTVGAQYQPKARAAAEARNERILGILAEERTTSIVIAELGKIEGKELSRDMVQRLLSFLELEGRIAGRRNGSEKTWKVAR